MSIRLIVLAKYFPKTKLTIYFLQSKDKSLQGILSLAHLLVGKNLS
jgi:hypothetical protein